MNSLLLHYQALARWNHVYRKGLLNTEHLESGQKHFTKFRHPGGAEEEVDFWGYALEKNGVKYLIDFGDKKPTEVLPILVDNSEKVSYKADAYQLVKTYIIARFRSEKRKSARDLIDSLCSLSHANPTHQKLLIMMALSQFWGRANYRVCSPPGVGKDSSVELLGNIVGNCISVTNPTLAKLERKTDVSWLVINEMMGLGKADWNLIEQFLLTAGDLKPRMEKHSLAYKDGKDSFDISNLSLSIFYNDLTQYNEETFFDARAKGAVKDRFPAFRVWGGYTERFDKIGDVNVKTLVEENKETYKDLIYTIVYYKDNIEDELHRYDTSLLDSMLQGIYPKGVPQRHRDNLRTLFKAVDLYCESQDEFNAWVTVVVGSMADYQAMLKYPEMLEWAQKKLSRQNMHELEQKMLGIQTFTEKLRLIEEALNPKTGVKDVKGLW